MQADQTLRRLFNRARRAVIGAADHDPLVEIEGAEPASGALPPPPGARARRVAGRWLRTIAAFAGTLAVFAALYGASVAWRERVTLPADPAAISAPERGSKAVAAAALLLALDRIDPDREAWFTSDGRTRRAASVQDGAAEAVDAFVEIVERRRAGNDKDLALAVAALTDDASAPGARYAVARDALRRFNSRAARRGQPIDRGVRGLAALARAAASSVESHAHALTEIAQTAGRGAIRGDAESEFYRARGSAYAWRLLLGAYNEDMPLAAGAPLAATVAAARRPLGDAASFEPAFMRIPPAGDANPLRDLAARLAGAALAVRALGEVGERGEGP